LESTYKKTGGCIVCGASEVTILDPPFSDSFTGYSELVSGDGVCEKCNVMFIDRNHTWKSWIKVGNETTFYKMKEMRQWLLAPPERPFSIYLTKGRKKIGWIPLLRLENYSQDNFIIGTDFLSVVMINRKEITIMDKLISTLREHKTSKNVLLSGEFPAIAWRKAIEEGWEEDIKNALGNKNNPQWEVMVHVAV